MQSTWYI